MCNNKHNSLLHLPSKQGEAQSTSQQPEIKQQSQSTEDIIVNTHSSASSNHCVLLSTAVIYVIDNKGCKQQCRILLDNGSQANFITRSFANKLGLAPQVSNITICGINNTTSKIIQAKSFN